MHLCPSKYSIVRDSKYAGFSCKKNSPFEILIRQYQSKKKNGKKLWLPQKGKQTKLWLPQTAKLEVTYEGFSSR
jgi:hypothetical protein